MAWLLTSLTCQPFEAMVAGYFENKNTWGCMCYSHTPAVALSVLENLLEIVWRIFKVSFLYFFFFHLHSRGATQRLSEIAVGSGGIIERSHGTQPGFWKRGIFSSSSVPLLYHFDHFWDIKY